MKIGMDKNLEIGVFCIQHFAGLSGVLGRRLESVPTQTRTSEPSKRRGRYKFYVKRLHGIQKGSIIVQLTLITTGSNLPLFRSQLQRAQRE